MHIPEGFWKDGLGDIDVISHDGVLHAFHLCIPSHDRVGHLTSRDGLVWEEQAGAIITGNPSDFDDDQIWTMGVFKHEDRFFMLYTGVTVRERGKVQRVGLAVSADLMTWQKHEGNPLICADPEFYEAATDAQHRVDWRDPFVISEGGLLHGVICARVNQGPGNRRGAAGYFVSRNGFEWTVQPALCVPGNCYDFETPALAKVNGRFYLTGICGQNAEGQPTASSIFRVADRVEGPYRRVGCEALLPGHNQVFKPCGWQGRTLYFHNLRGTADWPGGGGATVTALAPPKVADTDVEGGLVLRPFRGWSALAHGPSKVLSGQELCEAGVAAAGQWSATPDGLSSSGQSGYEAFLLHGEFSLVAVEAEVRFAGEGEFGLVARSDAGADEATFVCLNPILRRVQLCTVETQYKTPCAGVTYRWRGRRVVQEWICPWTWSHALTLRAVFYGPYCEVSVDDRVVISAISQARMSGQLGFYTEDTRIDIRSCSIEELMPSPSILACQ